VAQTDRWAANGLAASRDFIPWKTCSDSTLKSQLLPKISRRIYIEVTEGHGEMNTKEARQNLAYASFCSVAALIAPFRV
jgi:hypothetical protein